MTNSVGDRRSLFAWAEEGFALPNPVPPTTDESEEALPPSWWLDHLARCHKTGESPYDHLWCSPEAMDEIMKWDEPAPESP